MKIQYKIALPLLIGLLIGGIIWVAAPNGDPLVLRLSWIAVPLLIGGVFSLFAALGAMLARQSEKQTAALLTEQAQQFGRNHRRFVQRLDHELKNPLTAIRASVSNLQSTLPDATSHTTAITTMDNHTKRLTRLTVDLRKIAELENRDLETNPVDLAELLTELRDVLTEQHPKRQLLLTLPTAPWPLPTITADWDLLFLAFYNLADNALKFTESDDTVELRAREETAAIVIEVADTGRGIAPEDVPFVWEELYRGENGRTASGSGLGLPLVKAIIERHAGSIALQSRPKEGTNVTVTLPK